ncbi:hypothetical protein [Candidatus Nitrospira allomarina]|uniref:Uncharacterized protein n=1 Tax=Candidatus Nitrospira allomarina TaxID=3020900 RepID=A0AA96JXY4_9BACT|nr:hypothetical protein [Candidatus Nitrospira allomarina]WNM59611.1 hypothetical protein PP769_07615 [Candidatus Nitrospira allomarina]
MNTINSTHNSVNDSLHAGNTGRVFGWLKINLHWQGNSKLSLKIGDITSVVRKMDGKAGM